MNMREEGKAKTKQKIIDETKKVLFEKGSIKMSTKDISNESGVSQGTIFLHFASKENLINYILNELIRTFYQDLQNTCKVNVERSVFLNQFLNVFSRHEDILSIVYKDYFYLSDEVQRTIDQVESNIKSLFFDQIRSSQGKEISIVDSFVLIDGFLSQIKLYLYHKELQTNSSVIKQSTGKLNKLYKYLFK